MVTGGLVEADVRSGLLAGDPGTARDVWSDARPPWCASPPRGPSRPQSNASSLRNVVSMARSRARSADRSVRPRTVGPAEATRAGRADERTSTAFGDGRTSTPFGDGMTRTERSSKEDIPCPSLLALRGSGPNTSVGCSPWPEPSAVAREYFLPRSYAF